VSLTAAVKERARELGFLATLPGDAGLIDQLRQVRMGTVEDFGNFVNAVIDERSYENITAYLKQVEHAEDAKVLVGGYYSNEAGYFIEPTVLQVTDPAHVTMCEEIFGPVVSVYVYRDKNFLETLELIDRTSPYALTGAVFAHDRKAIVQALEALEESAGNFYINDKPTGAIVGQQPFGGARASGTNDKAGSYLNLIRWVSARSIKETFNPPRTFRYPFLSYNDRNNHHHSHYHCNNNVSHPFIYK
jgi:1-pyrroline-5-carboxylate dehydrogenase